MATILDLSLLEGISFIFPWLLVFAFVFAILQKTKVIGENKSINGLIAVVAAFTILLSKAAIAILNFVIPWFAVAIIFFILLVLLYMIFGHTDKSIFEYVKEDKGIGWALFVVGLLIVIAGFGSVFGQQLTSLSFPDDEQVTIDEQIGEITVTRGVGTPSHKQNVIATLFHPKILGFIVIFIIAIFTVSLLSQSETITGG